MSTILSDQTQSIENAINQGLAAAGSALAQPIMLAVLAVVFVPPLIFGAYKLLCFVGEIIDIACISFFAWDSGDTDSRNKIR